MRVADNVAPFDGTTSRSICNAVGERLQQQIQPQPLNPSSQLQHLLDELRRQDEASGDAKPSP
jgi:hypothetical protein